jgi:hypothetical protein
MSARLRALALVSGLELKPEEAPGTPLPTPEECTGSFGHCPDGLGAYQVCLDFEQHAIEAEVEAKTNTKGIEKYHVAVSARILGYLLLFAPSQIALAEVATAIHSCNKDYDKLLELGDCFLNLFIHPCESLRHCRKTWI